MTKRNSKAQAKPGLSKKAAPGSKQYSKHKPANTKQQRLIDMLRRPQGATITQIAKALEWQPHTVRGTIAGSLKKRLGLTVTSKKEETGRIYRIGDPASVAST